MFSRYLKAFALLLIVGYPFRAFNQQVNWEWLNPLPAGNQIYDMQSVDSLHTWAAGTYGTILATSDGGKKWELQPTGSDDFLISVSFIDIKKGWACGLRGTILRTKDGGSSWKPMKFPRSYLRDISFRDSLNGWLAVAYTDKLYYTIDGGQSWDSVATGNSGGFTQVKFFDSDHGLAVSTYGPVFLTSDGGASWQTVQTGAWYPNRLCMLDTLKGFMCDGKAILFTTKDGGQTWTKKQFPEVGSMDIFFLDKDTGWVAGLKYNSAGTVSEGRVGCTTNGGKTFTYYSVPGTKAIYTVTFADSRHGWSVDNCGILFVTNDGGKSWAKQSQSVSNQHLTGVFSLKGTHKAWCVGYSGTILKTENDGKSWSAQQSNTSQHLMSVCFTDENHGIAVGCASPILKTNDGGEHWDTVPRPANNYLGKVYFRDSLNGWITSHHAILNSIDGGNTWSVSYSTPEDFEIHDIAFTDSLHGHAVGSLFSPDWESKIIATSDGGQTWNEVHFERFSDLYSVCFTSIHNGWACGSRGHILHTTDEGETWETIRYSDTLVTLYSICFTDSLNGWIVGENSYSKNDAGLILRTIDGGVTWNEQPSGVGHALNAVTFNTPEFGYAVGFYGTILKWGENSIGIEDKKKELQTGEINIFPNPTDQCTNFRYIVTEPSRIRIIICDLSGKELYSLIDSFHGPGMYNLRCNTSGLTSGIYLCRLLTGSANECSMMIVNH
ncbi:MAG TPA: YCF48-related protein [Bacteroidales bacterium]|nr:YCF48-related protein [Bacteroidales bacterium]